MHLFATAAVAALLATPALAASPFDGTWTFEAARSKLAGDTISFTRTAQGYRYSDGGALSCDFATDGRDYPTSIPDHTMSVTATPAGFVTVGKVKGKVTSRAERDFSDGGDTMTSHVTLYRPDGRTTKEMDVYKRVSTGSGLAGTWRSVKVDAPSDTIVIQTPAPGRYVFEEPSYKSSFKGALDGSPAELSGPTVPANGALGVKAASPREWTWSFAIGGKPDAEGKWVVSADGRTLTQTSWTAGHANEATTAVCTKS